MAWIAVAVAGVTGVKYSYSTGEVWIHTTDEFGLHKEITGLRIFNKSSAAIQVFLWPQLGCRKNKNLASQNGWKISNPAVFQRELEHIRSHLNGMKIINFFEALIPELLILILVSTSFSFSCLFFNLEIFLRDKNLLKT